MAVETSSQFGFRKIQFHMDWVTRPVFGLALAAIAVGSIAAGVHVFAGVVAVTALASAREWHRMVENHRVPRELWATDVAIVASLGVLAVTPRSPLAWALLGAGAICVYALARVRRAHPFWHAAGVLYIGVPSLCVVALRALAPQGALVVVGLFLAVWATDTSALIVGNLIGGPKLSPVLSPNKTWSGTLGGIAGAAAIEAVYIGVLHGDAWRGALYAALASVVAHGGDLFESWVKRTFQYKDSGGLIPGHGGVLDRVDSTLAVSVAVSVAVFVFNLNPLFGAHL